MKPTGQAVFSRDLAPPARAQLLLLFSLYCLRLLALSLVLPVLSPFARSMSHSTAAWTGLAVGVYGLTQGLFQVPLGIASDRWGRKPVLAGGIAIFALGSVACAMAHTIYALILGRFLQGAGAVASTLLAYVADLTDEESRPQAMAWLGTVVGATFGVGVVLGPVLVHNFTLPGVFWGSAVVTALGSVAAMLFLAEPARMRRAHAPGPRSRWADHLPVLHNPALLKLAVQVFLLHFTLTGLFVVVPLRMAHAVAARDLWSAYLPIILAGLVMMFLATALQRRFPRPDLFVLFAWVCVAAGTYLALTAPPERWALTVALGLFVTGFAVLEPLLPSLFTRLARASVRGAALGVFNGAQFIGAFAGGLAAGALVEKAPLLLAWTMAGLAAMPLLLTGGLRAGAYLRMLQFPVSRLSQEEEHALADRIRKVRGVLDVSLEGSEALWVQCDVRTVEELELRKLVGS